jgi:ComF family protein
MPTSAFELYRAAITDTRTPTRTSRTAHVAHLAGQLVAGAVDLFYPAHCMACGESLEGTASLCESCAVKVQWIGTDCCRRCGAGVGLHRGTVESCPECATHPPVHIEATCAVAKYGGPLRAVILGLKFGGGLQAVPLLSRLMVTRVRTTQLLTDSANWAVVPVPLAPPDAARRGFNQAEELAAALARAFGAHLEPGLLKKVRSTEPQATLDHTARAGNLRGVFAADAKRAKHYAATGVLLVDDVMTTGATLSECARTLHEASIKRIRGAVIARG